MTFEPKIVAFLCTWCSYTGADTAGIARLKSPGNIRAVRVPCSGRISPEIIMRTFDQGADGVLVLGCHIGECHYDSGNHRTAKRLPVLQALMAFAGLEPERLRLDWVSASEGERFARITTEFTQAVRLLGPIRWWAEPERVPEVVVPGIKTRATRQVKVSPASAYQQMTAELQEKAAELLAGGQVASVIGYEVGPRGRTRPVFIANPQEASRLTLNQDCTHNLVTYLPEKLERAPKPTGSQAPRPVAVLVKPCDARTVNVQLAENRYRREQVHLIGIACGGIRQGAGYRPCTDGGTEELILQPRCQECDERLPSLYDTLIGEGVFLAGDQQPITAGQTLEAIQEIDALPPAERMEFWLSQFDRCIRCYACRQACPMCDCPTCLYERDDSLWVGMGIRTNEKRTFHLGRAFHLAGRCIGCNECERVCPMEIPISLLNRKLAEEVAARFGHRAGQAPLPSPFTTILGGEEAYP